MRRRLIPFFAVAAVVLSGAPGAAAGEPAVTVEGELQRLSIEMDDGASVDLTVIVPEDGEALRVQTDDMGGVPTGSVVAVEVAEAPASSQDVLEADGGADVMDVDVLEAAEVADLDLADAGLAAAASSGRPVSVVVGTIAGQASDGVTAATIAGDLTGSVSPYWSDSTAGAVSFAVASQTAPGAYSGWGSSTCTTDQILGILRWSADVAGVYPTAGQGRHSVLYTPRYAACSFAGVAHVADGGSAWINGSSGTRWATIAHELGHTLTLGHSDSRPLCPRADGTSTACQNGAYGDAYDVMGTSSGGVGPLNGAHLDALGLLSASSTVVATDSTTVRLAPVGSLSGLRFLRFSSGAATYYVEYRGAVGRDADLASTRKGCPLGVTSCGTLARYVPGVVVRRVDSAAMGASSYLLDAAAGDPSHTSSDPWFVLTAGKTFTTVDMAVSLTVVTSTSGYAEVRLTTTDTSPRTPFSQVVASPDFTGNRVGDLFAVDQSGRLYLYAGQGGGSVGLARVFGTGWEDMRVFAPGDWNGDRRNDLVAADDAGYLWLYPGDGRGGFSARRQIGNGWSTYRIVPAGDVNGDGRADLLAIDSAGRLWLYPGAGGGAFGRPLQVGNGWKGFELYAAGDMNRDGRVDILSIDSAGRLWYYAGRGGGYFSQRRQVGNGWTGYEFASGADLNSDGINDLIGRDQSGRLWFYAGRVGGTFAMKIQIGSGW